MHVHVHVHCYIEEEMAFKQLKGNFRYTESLNRGELGAQWLNDRVLDLRPRGVGSSLIGVTALWS